MRSLGQNPTDAEVQDMINEVDVDGSGAIEFPEFCVMMVKKMQESDTENEIREAYRVFDKERTGVIAVSEMRLILSNLPEKLSEEEIEEMLATADRDGNGSFSYDEFRMMIGSTLSMKQMWRIDYEHVSATDLSLEIMFDVYNECLYLLYVG